VSQLAGSGFSAIRLGCSLFISRPAAYAFACIDASTVELGSHTGRSITGA
jgi:hypothetical protein